MNKHIDGGERPSLLLLSVTGSLSEAVGAAATAIGVPRVSFGSGLQAAGWLSAADNRFSHLLVEPGFAGDLLPTLAELTAGEAGSGTELILLGRDAMRPMQATPARTRIVDPDEGGWLARAIGAATPQTAPEPELTLAELHEALGQGRITTRYQPVVRISDGLPVGLEVLARLESHARGTVPPDLFVPLLERAGLGRQLTEAVILRAFADWGGGRLAASGLSLAVNMALDVMLMPDSLAWLEARRLDAGIPADRLVVELTEGQPLGDLARLHQAVAQLRQLGYRVAIDDVGPAVRDYHPLLALPFTTLKLDKTLVQTAPEDPYAEDFLARTIATARRSGLRLIAEGVQNEAIWRSMACLGVDEAQGFVVARPLPLRAVPLWLADWRARHPSPP